MVIVLPGPPAPDMPTTRRERILCAVLGYVLLAALSSPAQAEWLSLDDEAMGTTVGVELWHADATTARDAAQAVINEMHRVDQAFSPWIENSQLSRLNRRALTNPQPVSPELEYLLERSLFYSHLTGGAFDITFASVGRYYDFRAKQKPSDEVRREVLPAVDYRRILLDKRKHTVSFTHPEVQVDLGGIAKGYAVDQAIKILQEYGVEHASVSAGGDSRVLGDRRGRPWMIGIKKPRSLPGDDEPAIVLPLQDAAVSTSGDYERYFIDPETGQRVHHILNPRTGQSAEGPVSVTVIGRHGIDTDALSTSVFVLGVVEGLALINGLPGFDCIIVDSQGQVHYSDGLIDPTLSDN